MEKIIICFMLIIISIELMHTSSECKDSTVIVHDTVYIEKEENKKFFCTGTYYNACEAQCNEDFLYTASNDEIDTVLLNRHELRWIALSRDLMEHFRFNDTVIIESENYRINGEWIVKDVMNKRWNRRVDFLVPFNDTLKIGKTQITIKKK